MNSAGQNKVFSTNKTLNVGGRLLTLDTPLVMGILNVTPDSFYDGGRFTEEASILKQVERMISEGATIVDVGGYSSRPGATDVSSDEEAGRVIQALQVIRKEFKDLIISVDTFRSAIARQAVAEGADMINDISGGEPDKAMFETVADLNVPYICMHMKGTPQTMNTLASYENLLTEITTWFSNKLATLSAHGVKDVIIDPGIGFAKTVEHNFELLSRLHLLSMLGKPMLIGLSRKSMIWRTLNTSPEWALNGTTALNMVALLKGASILRVHDVKEAVELITLFSKLNHESA
ncbi:MAG: dihydropteroate synthase [Flammeovirgaceae bacterium]|nr:MAG: dihydropteroate synthase [Flammeovirgaceae bacterium]